MAFHVCLPEDFSFCNFTNLCLDIGHESVLNMGNLTATQIGELLLQRSAVVTRIGFHRSAVGTQADKRGFTSKVSDFGLSKLWSDTVDSGPAAQEQNGTVTHMSPELLSEGTILPAADVYAFGIISERPLPYLTVHSP